MKGLMSSITKYHALLKAVECGSFTKAAAALDYSQSGISRMIADLESEWNISLLERSSARLSLTAEGLSVLPLVQEICNAETRLQDRIAELNGLEKGFIRIGTFSSVATHWLPNIIARFQNDYPGIEYELLLGDYEEIERWILDGRVDCGFLRLPVQSDLETEFLEQDRLLAVLPENHPLAEYAKLPIKALRDYPFMMLERENSSDVAELMERRGVEPDTQFITWDDYAILAMVEKGLGISILPELILKRIPYRLTLRELDVPAYRSICFAVRTMKNASPAVRKFKDYLVFRSDSSAG